MGAKRWADQEDDRESEKEGDRESEKEGGGESEIKLFTNWLVSLIKSTHVSM